jgi:hypothetical protein
MCNSTPLNPEEQALNAIAHGLKDTLEERGAGQPHYSRSLEVQRPGVSYAGEIESQTNELIEEVCGNLEQALGLQKNTP